MHSKWGINQRKTALASKGWARITCDGSALILGARPQTRDARAPTRLGVLQNAALPVILVDVAVQQNRMNSAKIVRMCRFVPGFQRVTII